MYVNEEEICCIIKRTNPHCVLDFLQGFPDTNISTWSLALSMLVHVNTSTSYFNTIVLLWKIQR